ncbi:hypothetical protein TWF970_006292 [Orbilia oligospora]|uniref:Uncharacterized protein n=1 Tax=Orbilia oligospora TaxID=2813651 RepID=A0A7C8VEU5_ORBOL|nr:hypothetical protein TWF970_006292 [Orbilia oligospora]
MSTPGKAHFKIPAIAGTDIWRKPSTMLGAKPTNVFNAPTACLGSKLLRNFRRARISFSLPPRSELNKYDQGGLLLSLKREGELKENSQWIKTGIEYYLDEPWVGTDHEDVWLDVSAYTARPLAKEGKEKEELIVKFWDDEVVWGA